MLRFMRASWWSGWAVVLVLAISLPAVAQTMPPDVVRLTNGGMVRGTIVENLPGDHVTIQLTTGEMRTFPSAEVASAGAAAAEVIPPAPSAALLTTPIVAQPGRMAPYAPPGVPTVRVHVEATSPELTLQEVVGTSTGVVSTGRGFSTILIDNFAPLCSAPCDIELQPRAYVLGVSQGQGGARRADHNLFTVDSDMSLELEYESREAARIVGWIVFIGGALAGAGIMLGGILGDGGRGDGWLDWLIAGAVVLGVSEIVGLALAFLNDHADIRRIDGTVRF